MNSIIPVTLFILCLSLVDAARLIKRQNADFFFPEDDNERVLPTQQPTPPTPPTTTSRPTQSTTGFPGLSETTTNPPPGFFNCLQNCPTTPEYNPICGSNRVQYFNEQKFNCARRCGAQVNIARRGSCTGIVSRTLG
ncbi:hypothetical protein ACFFRR_010337 [Megaselia abdita]